MKLVLPGQRKIKYEVKNTSGVSKYFRYFRCVERILSARRERGRAAQKKPYEGIS
jgi:hypothetical protein